MSSLSVIHKQKILTVCQTIDRQLGDVEACLAQANRPDPLAPFQNDMSAGASAALLERIEQVRQGLVAVLRQHEIPLDVRQTGLRGALESKVIHLEVLVDDMRPKQMAAYGRLDPEAEVAILEIQRSLSGLLRSVRNDLRA